MALMMPLIKAVDAVLFDLDGTLVETNIDFPLMKRRMLELAAAEGIDTEPLASLDILGIVDSACRTLVSWGLHENAEDFRMRAMDMLEEIELRHANDARQIPFARDIIACLTQNGIKTGIVTRNCRKASLISLEKAGIMPDILVCREDTSRHKPHPEPLLFALTALGARPERSIMVGDHLMDIEAGKAAGLKTIALLWDYRPADFFNDVKPDRLACNLQEVLCAIIDCDS